MTTGQDPSQPQPPDGSIADFDAPSRARAEALVEAFTRLGVDDPAAGARAEIDGNDPALARLTFLRAIWRHIDQWRDIDTVPGLAGVATDEAIALAARVATRAAFDVALAILELLDDEHDTEAPTAEPGWGLIERGADGRATGRALNRLHDHFLQADPRAIEGRDILDP